MDERIADFRGIVHRHPLLGEIARLAAEQGLLPIYLVGGFVRDTLLERRGALDFDVVSRDPYALATELERRFAGTGIGLAAHVRRVVFAWKGERVQVDVSPVHGESILADLCRRDFTINALAFSFTDERLIDPTGGLKDLEERRIRVTDPDVLLEDPLRLLRSVRLAAQLQFAIEETTAEAVRRRASLLGSVAAERLREELFQILDCADGGCWLAAMDQLAILEALFPEIRPMRGCQQGPPHRYDVLTHSLETVRSLDRIIRALSTLLPDETASLTVSLRAEVEGGITRQALLRFNALLHDVGKPGTRSMEDGHIRFLGHAARGASIVGRISARLRLGARASTMTEALVRDHLRPLSLRQTKTITPRARYRFWRDLGPLTPDLLLLSLADIRATWGEEGSDYEEHVRFVREMFAFRRERLTTTGPPSLVDGHELMARMHLSPGPFVGFVLAWLREEASLGLVTTKEEAWQYLERHLQALREAFSRGESLDLSQEG